MRARSNSLTVVVPLQNRARQRAEFSALLLTVVVRLARGTLLMAGGQSLLHLERRFIRRVLHLALYPRRLFDQRGAGLHLGPIVGELPERIFAEAQREVRDSSLVLVSGDQRQRSGQVLIAIYPRLTLAVDQTAIVVSGGERGVLGLLPVAFGESLRLGFACRGD